jgi:phosphatidylinositol alpha-1,6-mannosyltransferase
MYLIVTRSFPPEAGGMQNLMWGLTNAISKHYMVKVFADHDDNSKSLDENVSYSIERIGGPKLIRKYRKAYLVNDFIKNNKNIKGIIADHWKSLERIKTNKKKICLIHSKEINHKKGSLLNKRVLKVLNNIDYVVSNSKFTENLAINSGVDGKKIIVINPGVEPSKELSKEILFEAEDMLQHKNPRLITVSRLEKRKNHEKIIMSLRNLKQLYPNIIYTCIGYGEEEENIKKLVKELNLENQVLFLKNISQELKNALLAKSNLFVMPSVIYKKSVEGFGIAYIEAAQYGLPSIGGKDGGEADAIKNNETGIICDGNSLDEIYSSIDLILKNNSYKNFINKTKEFAKKFEWDNIIKQYFKIL